MTQIVIKSDNSARVLKNGRVLTIVPLTVLSAIGDADIDAALARAQECKGCAVTVPSFARVPRPRHSVQATKIIF